MQKRVEEFMQEVIRKNPGEAEFHQAVREVVEAVMEHYGANPKYVKARVLERMTEPERVIIFRVPWLSDKGEVMINRGYRIEMSPFGGIKDSGLGYKEGVLEAMKSFTNVKTWSLPWPG